MRPEPEGFVISGDPQIDSCVMVVRFDAGEDVVISDAIWDRSLEDWYHDCESTVYLPYPAFLRLVSTVWTHFPKARYQEGEDP